MSQPAEWRMISPYQARALSPLLSESVMIAIPSSRSTSRPNRRRKSACTFLLCVRHAPTFRLPESSASIITRGVKGLGQESPAAAYPAQT